MLRLHNFVVSENAVSFVKNVSKTYHGGLKDLKRNPRNVKHYCHRDGDKEHNPCIVKLFKKYTSMISDLSRRNDAFYFRPSKTSYKFKDVPVGIHQLNSILPSLTTAAGLKRKTAHSLRVTCASTLFQNNVGEKLIRERTEHISNALFRYEKPCEEQIKCVSECLKPPSVLIESDDCKEKLKIESGKEAAWLDDDLDEYLASLNYEEVQVQNTPRVKVVMLTAYKPTARYTYSEIYLYRDNPLNDSARLKDIISSAVSVQNIFWKSSRLYFIQCNGKCFTIHYSITYQYLKHSLVRLKVISMFNVF